MLHYLFFTPFINTLDDPIFKGDADYFNTNVTIKEIKNKLNVFSRHKSEFNPDHTQKHVLMHNDDFDAIFGPPEGMTVKVHVPDSQEIQRQKEAAEFEYEKNENMSYLRRKLGIET